MRMLRRLALLAAVLLIVPAAQADGVGSAGNVGGDCVPTPEVEMDPETLLPAVDVSCDPSGAPCGVVQQPICWAFRLACYNGLQGAMDAYDYNARHLRNNDERVWNTWSSCETQPPDNW